MAEEIDIHLKKPLLYSVLVLFVLGLAVTWIWTKGYHTTLAKKTSTFVVFDATTKEPVPLADVAARQTLLGKKTTTSGEDGKVTISGLFPWNVTVSVKKLGYREETFKGKGGAALTDQYLVRLPAATMKGKVVDYVSEKPLEGVKVAAGDIYATSDKDGAFTLSGLFIDRYTLTLSKDGYNDGKPEVTISKTDFDAGDLTVTPKGTLVFVTNREGGKRAIYTTNYDGSEQEALVSRVSDTEDYDPLVSPHRKKIVFSSTRSGKKNSDGQPQPFLYIVNIDGSGLKSLFADEVFYNTRWSPDGTYVMYIGLEKVGLGIESLNVVDIVKNTLTRISSDDPDSGIYNMFDVSPDDKLVVFFQTSNTGKVVLSKPDGTERVVLRDGSVSGLLFQDSTHVLYYYYEGNAQKRFEYDIVNKTTKSVTPPSGRERTGVRDPSGKKLAYMDERDGKKDIFISDIDGKNEKQLTTLGTARGDVEWDESGKYLIFGVSREGESAQYIVAIDGGTAKKIVDVVQSYYYYDYGGGGGGGAQ
jgi:Tol biopolymer transport system component